MKRLLTKDDVMAAVKGGSIYACGGGGWVRHGLELGELATTIGRPILASMDEFDDEDIIATSAAIGAPGDLSDWEMLGVDYVKAVKLVQEKIKKPIKGLMIGQNGMSSTLNAWLPSALLGTYVADALGDLRAHPTGDMGSIGLSKEVVIQSAVGGNRSKNQYLELICEGVCDNISWILRTASHQSGGFIASCRNPIKASYVKQHAVLGGISMALELGHDLLNAGDKVNKKLDALLKRSKGEILLQGKVTKTNLQYTKEAFDVGVIEIEGEGRRALIHVMNEHMAVDIDEKRVSTYPDVITTLDKNAEPISAGHIKKGDEIYIFNINKNQIPLSSSIKDKSVYDKVEKTLNIKIADYALGV
ncbi:DUF917 family protein [Campylobacter coli]|nr:DUF917 family protein [Campylobacter coli]